MRRLRGAFDEAALAQKLRRMVSASRNIRGLGMKMILRRAQEAEALSEISR